MKKKRKGKKEGEGGEGGEGGKENGKRNIYLSMGVPRVHLISWLSQAFLFFYDFFSLYLFKNPNTMGCLRGSVG